MNFITIKLKRGTKLYFRHLYRPLDKYRLVMLTSDIKIDIPYSFKVCIRDEIYSVPNQLSIPTDFCNTKYHNKLTFDLPIGTKVMGEESNEFGVGSAGAHVELPTDSPFNIEKDTILYLNNSEHQFKINNEEEPFYILNSEPKMINAEFVFRDAYGTIRSMNLTTEQINLIAQPTLTEKNIMKMSLAGDIIIVKDNLNVIKVINPKTGQYKIINRNHDEKEKIWLDCSNNYAAYLLESATIFSLVMLDKNGSYVKEIWSSIDSKITSFALSDKFAAVGYQNGVVQISDLDTGDNVDQIIFGSAVRDVCWTPNGQYLIAIAEESDKIKIWNNNLVIQFILEKSIEKITVSPNNIYLASIYTSIHGRMINMISIWNLEKQCFISNIKFKHKPHHISFISDTHLLGVNLDGFFTINIDTGVVEWIKMPFDLPSDFLIAIPKNTRTDLSRE